MLRLELQSNYSKNIDILNFYSLIFILVFHLGRIAGQQQPYEDSKYLTIFSNFR